MSRKDGGAAFPGPFAGHCGEEGHAAPCSCYVDPGMTLRDYFASAALPQIQAFAVAISLSEGKPLSQDEQAVAAYRMADAMLRARSLSSATFEARKAL